MEKRENGRHQVYDALAAGIRNMVRRAAADDDRLEEIRMRTGQPLMIRYDGREQILPAVQQPHIVTKEEMRRQWTISAITPSTHIQRN